MKLEDFPEAPSDRLPDFMLAGMQKSGTTTVNTILSHHPRVFLKDDGKAFFKLDDFGEHPDFYPYVNDQWTFHDLENKFEEYYHWYLSIFDDAGEDQLIGEDKPLYMTSKRAGERIKKMIPDIKLIFILRDPVNRAYSNYWHKFRNGRSIFDFEQTLQYMPGKIIQRGYYEEHLRTYFDLFPAEQIKVVILEDLSDNPQKIADELFEFLELDSIDVTEINTHKHQSRGPRCMTFQLFLNRVFRSLNTNRYHDQLPKMPEPQKNPLAKFLYKQLTWVNMSKTKKPPKMKPQTREFLQKIYARENRGLSDLLGRDLSRFWSYFD